MIRVSRGPEPQALRSERGMRLSRAILHSKTGKSVVFAGYDVAKQELTKALNYKCVFCEMALTLEGSPVEHFRPKACVANKGEPQDKSRYWWLAWTWENLLLACDRCNTSYKGNQFPLEPGTSPLPALSFNLGAEHPLLIDPAQVDPRSHFRFKWSASRGRWLPVAAPGSRAGEKTIEVLGLDDDDRPTRHIQERVEPWLEELKDKIEQGAPHAVQTTWRRMLQSLFAPRQPFHAVTWDALDSQLPEELRQTWGLELPPLGRHESAHPATVFEDPPEFNLLPEELRLRVRALGSKADGDEVNEVLRDVLPLRSWSDEELARLLRRSQATIRAWRRKQPHLSDHGT